MMRRLRRLARDRRGAVTHIALYALVPIATALFLVADVGQDSYDRIAAQNGADALALGHATWSARALNTVAMNNVALTQAATVGLVSDALEDAMDELLLHSAGVGLEIAANIPSPPCVANVFTAIYCSLWHIYLASEAVSAVRHVSEIRGRYGPAQARDLADRTIRALNAFNADVVGEFPEHIRQVSTGIAERNGISDFYFHDRCTRASSCRGDETSQGMDLPLETGTTAAQAEFCLGMTLGTTPMVGASTRSSFSARGFPTGRGPFTHGGSDSLPNVKDHVNSFVAIGQRLESFKDFYDDERLPLTNRKFYTNYILEQKEDNNSFTRGVDYRMISLCEPTGVVSSLFGIGVTMPEFYGPIGANPLHLTPTRDAEDLSPDYKILTFARRAPSLRLGDGVVRRGLPDTVGYAQAVVFNADHISLFSQRWVAKLMPASRFADPAEVGEQMRSEAPRAFRVIADRLRRVTDTEGWRMVNAH